MEKAQIPATAPAACRFSMKAALHPGIGKNRVTNSNAHKSIQIGSDTRKSTISLDANSL